MHLIEQVGHAKRGVVDLIGIRYRGLPFWIISNDAGHAAVGCGAGGGLHAARTRLSRARIPMRI